MWCPVKESGHFAKFCAVWKRARASSHFLGFGRAMDGRYYKRKVDRVVQELREISEQFVFLIDDEAFVDRNFARAPATPARKLAYKYRRQAA